MERVALVSSLCLALGAAVAAPGAAPVTLRGEVVDLSCFLGRGASGPEHAECAERCIASTRIAGFRTEDGALYLLLRARESPPPAELVAGLAGYSVAVDGTPTERDGFKALRITAARRLD